MNRITRAKGKLVGGQIVRGDGIDILYDAAGQRKQTITDIASSNYYADTYVVIDSTKTVTEKYTYNNAGQLEKVEEDVTNLSLIHI